MTTQKDEFLWTEKYRPQNIDDCVLVKELKDTFNQIVKSGEIHNMLLCGSAGTGKTSTAKALCKTLDLDFLFINASEDSGIDILRNKIRQFASTVSLSGGYKVVILDESDFLNCLEENESIQLSDGSMQKLCDMVDNVAYPIISFNINTKEFENDIGYVTNRDYREVFEVVLDDDSNIIVTDDHPFIVKTKHGKVETRTIKQGFTDVEIILK